LPVGAGDRQECLSSTELMDLSEEAAVRREFDARNVAWLRVVLSLLVFVLLIECMYAATARGIPQARRLLPFVNLLFVATTLGVLDEVAQRPRRVKRLFVRLAALVARHVRAWTLGAVVVEYVLLMAFASGGGWMAWVCIYPLVMLGMRLLPVEVLLMHGTFIVAGAVEAFFAAKPNSGMALLALASFALVINVILMAIEGVWTSSQRTAFVDHFREEQRDLLERQRMRDELRFAREVQLSMLPAAAPALAWIDIAATSLPATEVGGDYYDFFILDDDRVALVCGDVAGHGLASGLVLAALRSGFTLLRDQLGEPARVLRRLHDLVIETSRRRMLVTTLIVLIDRATRRAVATSAGHPPMIVKRGDGATEAVELFAPPLGVRLPITTPERTLSFAAGDTFVLQSDGIYEALNAAGESYGIERVVEVVRAQPPGASAAAMRDAILGDVERFREIGRAHV